ncbi:ribosomal large subunit pseudouridine synthase B [Thermosporothrix hazakensis]|jgi:pseudouridine synthase|uniref:Pseudouridine synthase n=1 Tax=Thermosporothrix hazakensis TaxID=644383 RepID=A0A326TZ72_THEHA|nr:pseudouridine synthase [Thermosporothrix hazakensis]PZW22551.1 ribosomal large subunit pseudouridine synthase B [Thermosporothrix hazakensis]GCE48524.1 pseudouridine synthase [Thermosporothrix hazakensis]
MNKPQPQEGERLARFLARAGVASRRKAEELIAAGRVRVNETVISTQGVKVDPERDRIYVDNKEIHARTQHLYLLLHKPMGYVSTVSDPEGRPTVLDLLPPELRTQRLYPVGRLDRETSGLLLLTNDGDFAQRLTHPRYSKEKHYEAYVKGIPDAQTIQRLEQGVAFLEDDGRMYTSAPARVRLRETQGRVSRLAITLREGRKRQIRRMLDAVGHPVIRLKRVGIGKLTLKGVSSGHWRHLTETEIRDLLRQP